MSDQEVNKKTSAVKVNAVQQAMENLKTGSFQIALPKTREPMSTLRDKGIPYDFTDPEQLKQIRHWARTFYATHDVIPLLVDIYSKFPTSGMEFVCKDQQIADFYRDMFFNTLDYENFIQEIGKEYFIAGEVTTLGHFNEELGVWESEEILDPDKIQVLRSMFEKEDRVFLDVTDVINSLRAGEPGEDATARKERMREMELIKKYYPEMWEAGSKGEGLELSPALVSRMTNKISSWDLRGTPHMLRSFKSLILEESLNAAQDAVADRLYSPFILAKLGLNNVDGKGTPWIPSADEINQVADTMQKALAADFRMMVHHFGLDITSVFGRESTPRFDQDYDRIDKKILQAWGIGESLISGGSGGPYASSAINREFVTQMMVAFQRQVKKHIERRMLVVAEVQGHYDYEIKDDIRVPIMQTVWRENPETGEMQEVEEPKLLIPEVRFATLNLRDEAQERQFLIQLKSMGVPVSDQVLAVNLPIDLEEEKERVKRETVEHYGIDAAAKKEALEFLVENNLPVPPELASYFMQSEQAMLSVSQMRLQRKQIEDQIEQGINPATTMDFVNRGGRPAESTDEDNDNFTSPPNGRPSISDGGSNLGPGYSVNRPPESDEMKGTMPTSSKKKVVLIQDFLLQPSYTYEARLPEFNQHDVDDFLEAYQSRQFNNEVNGMYVDEIIDYVEDYARKNNIRVVF